MVLYRSPEQTDLHTYITVEGSAKFTALNFIALQPPPPRTPHSSHVFFFFLTHHDNKILKEGHQRNISAKLYWNWSSGFWQKDF